MWQGGGPCSDLYVRFTIALLAGFTALASAAACSDESVTPTPVPVVKSDGGSSGSSGTDSGKSGTLRVANFNVRRFFDAVCQSNDCTSPTSFEEVVTDRKSVV